MAPGADEYPTQESDSTGSTDTSRSSSDTEYGPSTLSQCEISDRGEKQYIKARADNTTRWCNIPPQPEKRPLQDQLLSLIHKRTEAKPGRGFMPRGFLDQVLTFNVVLETLRGYSPQPRGATIPDTKLRQYANQICHNDLVNDQQKGLRKIFAILILLDRERDIFNFIDDGLCDGDLPLAAIPDGSMSGIVRLRRSYDLESQLSCFSNWTSGAVGRFEEQQWSFVSPFFAKCESRRKVRFYVLSPKDVLPWTTRTDRRNGGYSEVYKVQIHKNHHNFDRSEFGDGTFALKKFRPGMVEDIAFSQGGSSIVNTTTNVINQQNIREAFELEVEILVRFSGDAHTHLVSLLAAIQRGNNYYLLFHWAQSDLLKFWKSTSPGDALDKSNLSWLLEQCHGIVGGLTRIHKYKTSEIGKSRDSTKNGQLFGRHGDIKPENFLLYKNENGAGHGTLKISDFGLARFHSEVSRTYPMKSKMANTPTYRPPECDMDGSKVSRAFDIWSLGCVFLEFLTWYLGGWPLLEKFVHGRKTRDIYSFNSDQFFEIVRKEGKVGARVKREVWTWINELHNNPGCCDIIHKFLDLIQNDMLVVEPNHSSQHAMRDVKRRADCQSLLTKIKGFCASLDTLGDRLTPNTWKRSEPVLSAVEITLNQDAEKAAKHRMLDLPKHDGAMTRAIRSSELGSLNRRTQSDLAKSTVPRR